MVLPVVTVVSRYRRLAWLLGALAVGMAGQGCAPDDGTSTPTNAPTGAPTGNLLPDHPITPAEAAAGVSDPGDDQVAPWDGIDGNVAALAPDAIAGGDDGSSETASRVDGLAACRPAMGYVHGTPSQICVTTLEGHLVEYRTAAAYMRLKSAAAGAGVSIHINSGFRTMDQQRYLYHLYLTGRGNLAASPGFSNHQSGLALDLNTEGPGVFSWLNGHANEYGFHRTVPSEIWHWERIGAVGGSPPASSGAPPPPAGCFSNTLGAQVANLTCVQSRFDSQWYECLDGGWRVGRGTVGACSSDHPLPGAGGICYSATLGRNVGTGTCLQSRLDSQWYQCTTHGGWSLGTAIPGSHRGPEGACTEVDPLH